MFSLLFKLLSITLQGVGDASGAGAAAGSGSKDFPSRRCSHQGGCVIPRPKSLRINTVGLIFRSPDPGTLIISSGPQFCRICRRSCTKLSTEIFYDTGDILSFMFTYIRMSLTVFRVESVVRGSGRFCNLGVIYLLQYLYGRLYNRYKYVYI